MNGSITNEQLYDAVSGAGVIFSGNLAGSTLYFYKGSITSARFNSEGIDIEYTMRSKSKPTGGLLLPDTPLDFSRFNSGSISLYATVYISGEQPFGIHWHGGEHQGVHFQKGRDNREFVPMIPGSTFNQVGDNFFMNNSPKSLILEKINSIRNNN